MRQTPPRGHRSRPRNSPTDPRPEAPDSSTDDPPSAKHEAVPAGRGWATAGAFLTGSTAHVCACSIQRSTWRGPQASAPQPCLPFQNGRTARWLLAVDWPQIRFNAPGTSRTFVDFTVCLHAAAAFAAPPIRICARCLLRLRQLRQRAHPLRRSNRGVRLRRRGPHVVRDSCETIRYSLAVGCACRRCCYRSARERMKRRQDTRPALVAARAWRRRLAAESTLRAGPALSA